MSGHKDPITWKGQILGFVEDWTADMFDIYGKWIPVDTPATRDFLKALQDGQQLWVTVGTHIRGTIEIVPGEAIEIKHRLSVPDNTED